MESVNEKKGNGHTPKEPGQLRFTISPGGWGHLEYLSDMDVPFSMNRLFLALGIERRQFSGVSRQKGIFCWASYDLTKTKFGGG